MIKSLWVKFLILLLSVSVVALSAAFIVRELLITDFREFREGEIEDRVYWITAALESSFEKAPPTTARIPAAISAGGRQAQSKSSG